MKRALMIGLVVGVIILLNQTPDVASVNQYMVDRCTVDMLNNSELICD